LVQNNVADRVIVLRHDLDQIRNSYDSRSRSSVDILLESAPGARLAGRAHIILIGIDRFGVKAFFADLLVFFDVLADPDVPVNSKYNINSTG
jgi:hypothetical protein